MPHYLRYIAFCLLLTTGVSAEFRIEHFINNTYKLEEYSLFKQCIEEILNKLLISWKDLQIIDDGRRITDEFKNLKINNGNNVLTLASYHQIVNNFKNFHKKQHNGFALLLLTSYDDLILEEYLQIIKNHEMHIIIGFYSDVSDEFLTRVMENCLEGGLENRIAIINKKSSIILVKGGHVMTSNCSRNIEIYKSAWIPAITISSQNWFQMSKKIDLKGCPLNVSTVSVPPNVIVDKKSNSVTGFETMIIEILAMDMNFRANISVHVDLIWGGYVNGTAYGILGDLSSGISEIAYGVIWPNNKRMRSYSLSVAIENDCLGWAVPRGYGHSSLSQSLTGSLTIAFRQRSWSLIFVSASIFCCFHVIQTTIFFFDKEKVIESSVTAFLVTVSSLVQKTVSQIYLTHSLSMKVLFMVWLFYTQIIGNIYIGVIAGYLVVPEVKPNLNTLKELLNTNLQLATTDDVLYSIRAVDSHEKLYTQVKNRIKVKMPPREYIRGIMQGKEIAYCRNLETLYYYRDNYIVKNGNENIFYIMKECFVTYPIVIAMRKGSFLKNRANVVIDRIVEGGFINHWKKHRVNFSKVVHPVTPEKLSKLRHIFYFLGLGYSLATLAFLGEIGRHRYLHWKERRALRGLIIPFTN